MTACAPDPVAWSASMLLGYRGPNGKCARLERLRRELASSDPYTVRNSDGVKVSGGTTGDPTMHAALVDMYRRDKLALDVSTLEDDIGAAAAKLMRTRHGDVMLDYYMSTDQYITWQSLANELGVALRTVLRWRIESLSEFYDLMH